MRPPLRVCAHLLDDGYSVRITKARGRLSFKETPKVLEKRLSIGKNTSNTTRSGHFRIVKAYCHRFKISYSPKCTAYQVDDKIFHEIFAYK